MYNGQRAATSVYIERVPTLRRTGENMNSHWLIQPMQGEIMYAVIVPWKSQPLSMYECYV